MWFTQRHQEQQRQWSEYQKLVKAREAEQLSGDIAKRTAAAEELPLAIAYAVDGSQWAVGVVVEERFLTVSSSTDVPETITVEKGGERHTWQLLTSDRSDGAIVIYGSEGAAKLPLGALHHLGKYDLQMVAVSPELPVVGDGRYAPRITLAEYTDGAFGVPLERPGSDAIALVKADGAYLPVGVYRHSDNALLLLDRQPALAEHVTKPVREVAKLPTEEKYYVLENTYAQLVFSTKGGALVEANLPHESPQHPASVVKPIEIDKKILEQSPANAIFPAFPYYTAGGSGELVEHTEGIQGGYYPLLRRGLIIDGKQVSVPAKLRALNVVSQYPEVAELNYTVKAFTKDSLVMEAVQPHRRITKTFTLAEGKGSAPYILDVEIRVDGDGRGLWVTSGVPEMELLAGRSGSAIKVRSTRGNKGEVENISLPKDAVTVSTFNPDWVCNSNGFLGVIVDPLSQVDAGYTVQHVSGAVLPTRLTEIDKAREAYPAANYPGYNALVPLDSQGGAMRFRLYMGPFANRVLKVVDKRFTDVTTGYDPDYRSAISFHGIFSFISQPFAKFLFALMQLFESFTGSWALSIILLTVALRVMLYPLNAWSMKSMRRMQKISPQMQAIQKKYKKDPKRAQMEVMALYREKGVNPLGGCFPMLIQLPFLIGMFDLLKSAFELRGAVFIPGWIDNLTAPDVLFRWETPIPLIGNEFHLLPIILGAIMFVQQKLVTPQQNIEEMTDQQRAQRSMMTVMPLLFTVMFYNFASGLNLYWLSSTILGIGQQWLTNRQIDKEPAVEVVAAPASAKVSGKGRRRKR